MSPENNPSWLEVEHILADASVLEESMVQRVRERLPQASFRVLQPDEPLPRFPDPGKVLYLKHYQGRFLRWCPGTSRYRCCGYRIVHIGENCPLSCSYCILQAYFQDRVLKVWANEGDLFRELASYFGNREERFRVGTGEFTDSLALESITGYSRELVAFLAEFPNVCLELKTKVTDLSWMDAVQRPDRVLPAWSLNAPEIVASQERGTASLEERLQAAADCAGKGFRVCLHFDPIIVYPGWEQGYRRIIDCIFDYLRPENIAYLSLGSFRCMPQLKELIAAGWPQATFIHEEMVTGMDGKLRLLRPQRIRQLRYVADRLKRYGLGRQIYLCMESDEVWRAALGWTPMDLGGLQRHLLELAFH